MSALYECFRMLWFERSEGGESMDIIFEIVSRQRFSASFPTMHVFNEAGGYIGRSEECDWVLPDKSRRISRKHAFVSFENGNFYIEDLSANGIFLTLPNEPMVKGRRHKIQHGEGFSIGNYRVMARLTSDPQQYISSGNGIGEDVHMFSQPLPLDPLAAMEEEEVRIAQQRLGGTDDILKTCMPKPVMVSNHTDPRISTFRPMVAVPEHMVAVPEQMVAVPAHSATIPDNWDGGSTEVFVTPSFLPPPASPPEPQPEAPAVAAETVAVPETDAFFKALGFAEAPSSPEERERILVLSAQLLLAAVDGMTHALQNRNEAKNELRLSVTTTGLGVNNNPLKFSPTPEAALATMLGQSQKGVLAPVASMREGFESLHSHHMGLLAGARAAVRASLERVAPQVVEARLDANGPVRFGRTGRLWHTFIRLHQSLRDDHEGLAALFLQDFARAYELQGCTLNPPPVRNAKGDPS